jgi:predicted membrane chloride channel (bestrophin family)
LIYVSTLPLVFSHDQDSGMWEDCITVFLLTYGFVGLLMVAAELDDPFGDDPNDFDIDHFSQFAVDDVIIMIHDADGEEWADSLRYKLSYSNLAEPVTETTGLIPGNYHHHEV